MTEHTPTKPGLTGALVAGRQTAFKPTLEDLRAIWKSRVCANFSEKFEYEVGFEEFVDDLRAGRVDLND